MTITRETGPRTSVVARALAVLLAMALAAATFVLPANTPAAQAHPLGNFSINRLSIIELASGGVSLTYLVDMAEIPTFQARGELDPDGDQSMSGEEQRHYLEGAVPGLLANLVLEAGGQRVALQAAESSVELAAGQGGLQTARIRIVAEGVLPEGWQAGASAQYVDGNFEGTNGWRQVIVLPGEGVELQMTTAAGEDVTAGLTRYPEDLLTSAPAVTSASFQFRAGTMAVPPLPTAGETGVASNEANKTLGRFADLVAKENLTPAVIAVTLILSAAWGAMHALGPGHGKTVVAAYLVGERGTGRHAFYLGLIVTATHTISVFALGAIAVFATDVIAADDVYFWLSLGSGLLVAVLGGSLLFGRVRRLLASRGGDHPHPHATRATGHQHAHDHGHPHDHSHGATHHVHTHGPGAVRASLQAVDPHSATHSHDGHDHAGAEGSHGHSHVPQQPGWRGLVALGVAGGIVPCPTALVVMLGAIALDRTLYGLAMVTAFSVGLAAVLTGIGLLMVYGKRWLEGRRLPLGTQGLVRRLQIVSPVLSALTIFGVGIVLTSQALV